MDLHTGVPLQYRTSVVCKRTESDLSPFIVAYVLLYGAHSLLYL